MYVDTLYSLKLKAKFSMIRMIKKIQPTNLPDTDLSPTDSNLNASAGAKQIKSDIVAVINEIQLRLSVSGAAMKHKYPIRALITNEIRNLILSTLIFIEFLKA